MNAKLELLAKVLRPISQERAVEIAHVLDGPGDERITLEDAGLVDEVRKVIDRIAADNE
jgi:hypothetical protein